MSEPVVELVEPTREVVEVDSDRRTVEVTEPQREVVEVVEFGDRVLYIVEPLAGMAPLRLADLADVADTPPADGQVPTWDDTAGAYVPATPSVGTGGAVTIEHTQGTPATVWVVNHNLGVRPAAVEVFSSDFGIQYAEFAVQHLSTDTLRISMDTPTAGKALIS